MSPLSTATEVARITGVLRARFLPIAGRTDRRGPSAGRKSCKVAVEHSPASLEGVRRTTHGVLHDWDVEAEQVQDVLLVVSELVTNAVVHALPPVGLRLSIPCERSALVHIEVSDGGPAPRPATSPHTTAPIEHGRGSTIVECLSQRTGRTSGRDGVTHWADVVM